MEQIDQDSTLLELAEKLVEIDEGGVDITPEEHAALGVMVREKVDRVVYFMKDVESRIERHKAFETDHKEARKHLEKSLDKFKDYVAHAMQIGGFEKISGEEWQIGTRKSEEVVIQREATAADAEMFPELVRVKTTFEWNKTNLKEFTKGGQLIDGVAFIRINKNLTTKVKK